MPRLVRGRRPNILPTCQSHLEIHTLLLFQNDSKRPYDDFWTSGLEYAKLPDMVGAF